MKGVQCYGLFGGIALKNHAFFFTPALPEAFMILALAFERSQASFDPIQFKASENYFSDAPGIGLSTIYTLDLVTDQFISLNKRLMHRAHLCLISI